MNEAKLLGRGVRFPPGVDAEGRWAFSSGSLNVRESIRVILQTDPRERLMLPAFGGGLRRFLLQPNVTATHRLIQEAITQSLGRWERRIELESVSVAHEPGEAAAARATIRYRVVATGDLDEIELKVSLA